MKDHFIDLVTPEEKFWVEAFGARFAVRRLTFDDKREIESEVYKHGPTENDLAASFAREWLTTAKASDVSTLKKVHKAQEIGARLAELEREKERKLRQLDDEVLDRVLLDWDGVWANGAPAECNRENKLRLPAEVKALVVAKAQSRLNTKDDPEAEAEEEKN